MIKIPNIAQTIGAVAQMGEVRPLGAVCVDTRQIAAVEGLAFFALLSPSGDGHRYVTEAYDRGVRIFVLSEALEPWAERCPDAYFLQVADTLEALQSLAKAHRQMSKARIIAITGSNGKTIVKEMLYTLLSPEVRGLYRSPASYNSQLGVALSLLAMPLDSRLAIIEAGISRPGEMARLREMIDPDEVIITHLGTAHSENFDSPSSLYAEKLQLARSLRIKRIFYYAVGDDERLLNELARDILGISCALYNAYNHPATQDLDTLELSLTELDGTQRRNLRLSLFFIRITLVEHFNKALEQIGQIRSLPMRMELVENAHGNLIINDSYSNDLDALEQSLLYLRQRGGDSVVLGAMEESGYTPEALLREVQKLAERYALREIYLLGWGDAEESEGWGGVVVHRLASIEALLSQHQQRLLDTRVLLVKGARRLSLERLVQRLSLREHNTKLEVDLSALRANLAFYRSLLPLEAGLIAMIKADAYGLGAVPIAQAIEASGHARYLAVAAPDEGKALRRKGIKLPIIVMNPQADSFETLRQYELDAEVYSLEMLEMFARRVAEGIRPALHLKLNSGMNRLGFAPTDLEEIVRIVLIYGLRLESVFSHLSVADDASGDERTARQAECLQGFYAQLCQALEQSGGYPYPLPRLHLLNTAGIERFSDCYAFDGARLGVGLYGFSPSGRKEVQAVARLRTCILQVRSVEAGEYVGYGSGAMMDRAVRLAILPIGYADGLHRRYGNGRWAVSVGGTRCPIVGNVCMDTCMIDVTALPSVEAGEAVVVFGDECTPLDEMARAGDTIAYEVLTSISPRVARVYY